MMTTATLGRSLACYAGVFLAWSAHANDGIVNKNTRLSLAAGKAHEVCITLTPQESLHYTFTGSAALDFNIHYHVDKQVHYPMRKNVKSVVTGVFTPTSRRHYCLMWKNKNTSTVELVFSYAKNSKHP